MSHAALQIVADPPPNQNSIAVMAPIDALPPEWRALVHEFGITIVLAMRDDCLPDDATAEDARMALEEWRRRRQDEWLRTNYVSARFAQRMRDGLKVAARVMP